MPIARCKEMFDAVNRPLQGYTAYEQ